MEMDQSEYDMLEEDLLAAEDEVKSLVTDVEKLKRAVYHHKEAGRGLYTFILVLVLAVNVLFVGKAISAQARECECVCEPAATPALVIGTIDAKTWWDRVVK